MSSDLQFGFKAECSAKLCSMILRETMSYYVNNSSMVFRTFLDATKALDRIRYCKLYRLLIDHGIPCPSGFFWAFTCAILCVWRGMVYYPTFFLVVNGVKQGGVN